MPAAPAASGLPVRANVDGFDRVDATHFYLSFTGDVTVPGLGKVQDEDVVYYNAGTWSLFFDGTAHGLTAGSQDLDAISIVGGTLYFSTVGNTEPARRERDGRRRRHLQLERDRFARVWDASRATDCRRGATWTASSGWTRPTSTCPSPPTTTTVPGLGTVQDEDVVFDSAGTWSVYFDGTAKGLTSTNQDVDAFDLP